jgi:hypothetical protein
MRLGPSLTSCGAWSGRHCWVFKAVVHYSLNWWYGIKLLFNCLLNWEASPPVLSTWLVEVEPLAIRRAILSFRFGDGAFYFLWYYKKFMCQRSTRLWTVIPLVWARGTIGPGHVERWHPSSMGLVRHLFWSSAPLWGLAMWYETFIHVVIESKSITHDFNRLIGGG